MDPNPSLYMRNHALRLASHLRAALPKYQIVLAHHPLPSARDPGSLGVAGNIARAVATLAASSTNFLPALLPSQVGAFEAIRSLNLHQSQRPATTPALGRGALDAGVLFASLAGTWRAARKIGR